MWLDRFSGQSTSSRSSSPSRAYSPAPRKPPVRSGLGLTASSNRSTASLDLSNNTSTTSLRSSAKLTNGSGLQYEQKPPAEVEHPSSVLRDILGIPVQKKHDAGEANTSNETASSDVDEDIDFGSLSLHEFARQPAVTSTESRLGDTGEQNDDRQKLEAFHQSVAESDEILKAAELYLTGFKAELGQVSAEIESLQRRSAQLNTQLENRRHVEKILGPAVEGISLSPVTVRSIAEGPIDDVFLRALSEVEARSARLEGKGDKDRDKAASEPVKALEDVQPLLQELKAKAVERIRDYVVAQIKALRSPNINAQVIQQQRLIAYKDLFSFLARQHPVLSEEIGQAYINTMRWYYSSHFARYQAALEKMQIYSFDAHDLLGAEPVAIKRSMASVGSRATGHQQQQQQHQQQHQPQHESFNLGKRLEILKARNTPAIPSYVAEDSSINHNSSSTSAATGYYYLEVPFRHFNQALIDNATAEYSVMTEISSASSSYQQITRRTVEILEPTFTLGHSLTKHLIENTTDCLGILICVRLNQAFAFELQRRKVPVMDGYINYTNILLWPRFQQIMDQHCESLRKAAATSSSSGTGNSSSTTNRGAAAAAAAFNLVSGGGTTDASSSSVAPHPITQRFGQLLHGLLALSSDSSGDDEPLGRSLDRLRGEYEALMTKLSLSSSSTTGRGGGNNNTDAKQQRARLFLHNNYSLVLTIISDTTTTIPRTASSASTAGAKGTLAAAQREHFAALVAATSASASSSASTPAAASTATAAARRGRGTT